jgi:hypothetical protein
MELTDQTIDFKLDTPVLGRAVLHDCITSPRTGCLLRTTKTFHVKIWSESFPIGNQPPQQSLGIDESVRGNL